MKWVGGTHALRLVVYVAVQHDSKYRELSESIKRFCVPPAVLERPF